MRILMIAAHCDDEILGCGGTVARLVKEGHEAYALILGEGITSRDKKRDVASRRKDINVLKKEARLANSAIGVDEVIFHDFPDNRFDTVPLLDIVKVIEKIKTKIRPEIIFTHYSSDLNIDHRVTYDAAITATRPFSHEAAKEIYSFEILSSTEWNYPAVFSPDLFFNITSTLKDKLEAMNKYALELREYPHPRSLKGIELNAAYWGMRAGLKYAEAFKSIRVIK